MKESERTGMENGKEVEFGSACPPCGEVSLSRGCRAPSLTHRPALSSSVPGVRVFARRTRIPTTTFTTPATIDDAVFFSLS